MSKERVMEITVGLFVSLGIAALLTLALNVSNMSGFSRGDQYTITASFDNVSGLKERSAVSIAGVAIGRVSNIYIDTESYEAVVEMKINGPFNEIPIDSIVSINTAGLLGEKYVDIDVGGAPDYLEEGSKVNLTQSSLVLENLIKKFFVDQGDKDSDDEKQ